MAGARSRLWRSQVMGAAILIVKVRTRTGTDALTPLWVVVGLAMAPTVALGLARFAYALLLPPMRAELGWDYAVAGALNTANAAGYLAGALAAAAIGRHFGDKRVFAVSLLLTAIAVGASGLTAAYPLQLALRFVAGVTGALAFVAGAGLTAAAAKGGAPGRAPTLLGVYFAGGGLGVTLSALAVPPLISLAGWRGGWLALGGLSLAATLLAWAVLGRAPDTASVAGHEGRGGWSARFLAPKLTAYALFGAGYIAYVTFIIAYLRGTEHLSSAVVSAFWALLGLSSIVAAFAWGPVLGRLKGGRGAAATIGTVTIGAALPLAWGGVAGAFVSAILFGGSFLAVVTAVTSFARRAARPHAWTSVIATLTVAFGMGQSIGPVLSGAFSDGPGGVRAGLWLSVAILAVASLVALMQREPENPR
jgi:predicted MFS family arabinose efflux permease